MIPFDLVDLWTDRLIRISLTFSVDDSIVALIPNHTTLETEHVIKKIWLSMEKMR